MAMTNELQFAFTHSEKLKQNLAFYFFEKAGDELPMHVHDDHGHASVVLRGRLEVFDDKGNTRELKTFDVVPQFTPGRPHGFRALEDDSALLNIGLPGGRDG